MEKKGKLWQPLPTLQERMDYGKSQRAQVPREAHAAFEFFNGKRADPVALIVESNKNRLPELVPIRHMRMLQSAFAFYRGTANVMAEDMAYTPTTNIFVQSCGDCHLMNFGGYGTPERNQVFDINDFDETLPAPFEWDLKRLAASIVVAGRYKGYADKENKKTAFETIKMYCRKMRKYSTMHQLDIWYSRLDKKTILNVFRNQKEFTTRFKMAAEKARLRTLEHAFPKLSEIKDGQRRIIDEPPLIYHLPESEELTKRAEGIFEGYFENLTDDKKALMRRFHLVDVAVKVVGVGSVGTRCFIALFLSEEDDPLILQIKEANSSVLENHTKKSIYDNHGARIVNGQRLMQAVSDIFLGWTRSNIGRDFYVRQLRDMKASAEIDTFTPGLFSSYGLLCGWALAKSHAKSGMSPEIAGYIGKSDVFAEAIASFAIKYADQAEKDFQALRVAAENKVIEVQLTN